MYIYIYICIHIHIIDYVSVYLDSSFSAGFVRLQHCRIIFRVADSLRGSSAKI